MAELMDGGAADAFFEPIDGMLNIFALANGVDLYRSDASRRFIWFMGGHERALDVGLTEGGGFTVTASAWPTDRAVEARTVTVAEGVTPSEITATLEGGIEAANSL